MTMIAYSDKKPFPVILGDLLITSPDKKDSFFVPSISENIMDFLDEPAAFHPYRLNQKTCILKDNVCVAVAGEVAVLKEFLKNLRYFCASRPTITSADMAAFLTSYKLTKTGSAVSFLILVSERLEEEYQLGVFRRGAWRELTTEIFGKVAAAGSGAGTFLEGLQRGTTFKSGYPEDTLEKAIQSNVILIASLLAEERSRLHTVKKHWGAGFEVVYYDGNRFKKLDDITYVINEGKFGPTGEIENIPVPAIVLHFKYYGDVLVITALAPSSGETRETETEITITYKVFKVNGFLVEPMNFGGTIDLAKIEEQLSFVGTRVAMGYILETEGGKYLPASFNVGDELKVQYVHPSSLVICMKREINDHIVKAAEEAFPNFK
jgi:hypothetical protein